MNEELKQKLLAEIKKSGFSHELDVVQRLRCADLVVFPNLSFLDAQDKPHEIDTLAILDSHDHEENWKYGSIQLHLVVECKASSDRPWVFFDDSEDARAALGLLDRLICLSDIKVQHFDSLLVGCRNSELSHHHYNDYAVPKVRTYFEAFGKDAGREIYQGVTDLWYALDCFRSQFARSSTNRQRQFRRTVFLHPVILFKGILVSAEKDADEFNLEEVPHVLLRTTDTVTNKERQLWVGDNETVIDVVREDYLEDYLNICRHDLDLCVQHLAQLAQTGWIDEASQQG